jgi:hypothetical protein
MASRNFSSSVLTIFWIGGSYSSYQEQVVDRMDEGLVLLQGTLACLPTGREIRPCSSFTHERPEVSHEALL